MIEKIINPMTIPVIAPTGNSDLPNIIWEGLKVGLNDGLEIGSVDGDKEGLKEGLHNDSKKKLIDL